MKKSTKISLLVGGIVIVLIGVIGITFAFFSTGGKQETANTFTSGCLNISLTDASASISLSNIYPVTDIEGLDGTSYDFTITNTCNTDANYQINLESLNQASNSLSADYIKVSLSSDTVGNVISVLSDNTSVTPEVANAYEAYNLYTGTLKASETKTYHLKLWLDYDATVEVAANKVYQSKINVVANPEIQVVDNLEATFELNDKTLTSNLTNNVTSATYCTTTDNICTPSTTASIQNNSYIVELQGNENSQMVCTRLNGTSKIICSNGLEVKKTYTCKGPACESILANMIEFRTRTDFSTTVEETTTGVIYKSADSSQYDDNGEVYYFAGNPTDNWVQFGGFYWRIIRINGNGSIRMIYSGNSEIGPVTTGEGTQIGTSAFNDPYVDGMSEDEYIQMGLSNAYVGYMYGSYNAATYEETHANVNESTIKEFIDDWYINNLLDKENYLDNNIGFCGDRGVTSGTGIGVATDGTIYAANTRLSENLPVLSCANSNDLYTVSGSSQGNKALQYPIGLITADEAAMAGAVYNTDNNGYYLYTGQNYWTLSPGGMVSLDYPLKGGNSVMTNIWSNGRITGGDIFSGYANTGSSYGVRPVINLRSDVTITGSGTIQDPYVVQTD